MHRKSRIPARQQVIEFSFFRNKSCYDLRASGMQTSSEFSSLDKKSQKEVQSFIEQQQQVQQIQAVVGKITELCWDKCVSKPGKDLTDTEKLVRPMHTHTRGCA
jgi:import inner membrane translocase subunit TIM8